MGRGVVPSKQQRFILYTPFASATAEASSFPHPTKCIHCARSLRSREARRGTGLCDPCYDSVDKICQCCHTRLALRQLHWNSGLCNRCYDSCEKNCRLCETKLDLRSQAARACTWSPWPDRSSSQIGSLRLQQSARAFTMYTHPCATRAAGDARPV